MVQKPNTDVRYDGLHHWPKYDVKRNRYRVCSMLTFVRCSKCSICLCLQRDIIFFMISTIKELFICIAFRDVFICGFTLLEEIFVEVNFRACCRSAKYLGFEGNYFRVRMKNLAALKSR